MPELLFLDLMVSKASVLTANVDAKKARL